MSYSLLNESGDLLTYPSNSLIGIIDDYADAKAALRDLTNAGFAEEELGILCCAEGQKQIDADGNEHGLLGKIAAVVREFGDVDNEQKRLHEKALREGHFLLAVRASEETKRDKATEILQAHGGHFINFYSPWVVEGVAP
ncbi:MAG: hypothetical protein HY231_07810 [Acidobacteria bacterium]|nr:hypothetical protein [Acidobacteriota bacterium]